MGQQPEIQDIYPLAFMQEGMLFILCWIMTQEPTSNKRCLRSADSLTGNDSKSIDAVFERYDIFRTTFIHKNVAKPRQVVLKNRPSRVQFHDISHLDEKAQDKYADRFRKEDKDKGFDLQSDPLMRVSILKKRLNAMFVYGAIIILSWMAGASELS